MLVTVDVSLEEHSSRGMLRGVSGDGKRSGEIGELENGLGGECLFKDGKGGVARFISFPGMRFLGEI